MYTITPLQKPKIKKISSSNLFASLKHYLDSPFVNVLVVWRKRFGKNNIVSHFFILKVSLPDIDSHYSQKDFYFIYLASSIFIFKRNMLSIADGKML